MNLNLTGKTALVTARLHQQHGDRRNLDVERLISKSFNFVPDPRSKRDAGQEPRGRQGF
jgi:hypothetical protein